MPRPLHAPSLIARAAGVVLGIVLALAPAFWLGPPSPASAGLDGGPTYETFEGTPLVGEFFVEGTQIDDVVLLWDEVLDPRFLPDPADFTVTINDVAHDPSSASMLFSGLASEAFIFGADGVTFMQLDLPSGVTYDSGDTVTLSYSPTVTPVRDLALNPATGFTDIAVVALDSGDFFPLLSVLDSYHGADKVVIALTEPVVPASLPDPGQFVVGVGAATVPVTAVADLSPGVGMSLIELTLGQPVTDPMAAVSVDYFAQPDTLVGAVRGFPLPSQTDLQVEVFLSTNLVAEEVDAGEPVTTASTEGPTPGDPVATTIVPASAGTVAITERTVVDEPPAAYEFFGNQVEIEMPDAPSADQPNVITLDIDASLIPSGQNASSIQVFRDGVVVPACTGDPGVAEPTPCVSERQTLPGGDVSITVLTVQASTWNIGLVVPMDFGGFLSPVDNDVPNIARAGRAIPVKFSLGGDRGLGIFEGGSPLVRVTSCTGLEDGDVVEETVTAGHSSLSYHAGSDTYSYVWKTSKAWAGSCRRLVLPFIDGTSATAIFDFRK